MRAKDRQLCPLAGGVWGGCTPAKDIRAHKNYLPFYLVRQQHDVGPYAMPRPNGPRVHATLSWYRLFATAFPWGIRVARGSLRRFRCILGFSASRKCRGLKSAIHQLAAINLHESRYLLDVRSRISRRYLEGHSLFTLAVNDGLRIIIKPVSCKIGKKGYPLLVISMRRPHRQGHDD